MVGLRRTFLLGAILAAVLGGTLRAHAGIGLVVGEPFGAFGTMMPVGHAGIYLDHLCAASPTTLRPCRDGEDGVVIARYHDLKATHTDWLAFPLNVFLYGVESPEDSPARMTRTGAAAMRERYREGNLENEVPDRIDRHGIAHPPKYGDWEEGIGATFDRNVYVYEVDTTPEQDAALLEQINAMSRRRRYSLGRANCADFAEDLLRTVMPHAFHRKVLADLDMTTPKTLARQMEDDAQKHPELNLRVYEAPQIPGTPPRSRPVRGAVESLLKTKRYLATLLVIQPEVPLVCWTIYEADGRWKLGHDAMPVTPEFWSGSPSTARGTTESAGVE